ncbi:DNA adenine methylase [Caminicella sporogenes]|uniref:DNA adenine methylase n=1 Tax=Caminicella sporogenes TaxID=166485 RepID=UPI00253FCFBD|nr:DNA adenine methylase [Caminicella sporogenes]WIF94451.1 DNA adenine methylase [Caminicella sporogenes]
MTLIKWPGGKSKEFKHIENIIPKKFDRYIEPFFGGGAIYFHLKPDVALINDISSNLMNFYRLIQENNELFKNYLYMYNNSWVNLMNYIEGNYGTLLEIYYNYRTANINYEVLVSELHNFIEENSGEMINILENQIFLNFDSFFDELKRTTVDKFKRTYQNEIKNGVLLSEDDLKDNILTGFMSGFYMHFRNIYNDIQLKRNNADLLPIEAKIANFYFIREYCYGSMFRYNKYGEFNIPYGGISYNKKNFKAKIDKLFSDDILNLFKRTRIYNEDFEDFITNLYLNENDFIFLDPPYDTDFSDYEGRTFDENDQRRLANVLYNIPAKFILIIKNTDFIFNLYNNRENINILTFDKQYTYNVRSRNERKTKHLIITNIDLE